MVRLSHATMSLSLAGSLFGRTPYLSLYVACSKLYITWWEHRGCDGVKHSIQEQHGPVQRQISVKPLFETYESDEQESAPTTTMLFMSRWVQFDRSAVISAELLLSLRLTGQHTAQSRSQSCHIVRVANFGGPLKAESESWGGG